MIARSWDGVTRAAQADEYAEYVQRTGVTDLAATGGNLGVYLRTTSASSSPSSPASSTST